MTPEIFYVIVAVLVILAFNYRWVYILYKTLPRDIRAFIVFIKLQVKLLQWNFRNIKVSDVFAGIASKYPNKVAYHFEDESWTFDQVDHYSNKIGTYFKNQGYQEGDTFALLLENRVEYICFYIAMSKMGCCTALINTNLTKDPLTHSINIAKCKAVIFGSNHKQAVADIKDTIGSLKLYQFEESPNKPKPTLEDAVDLRNELDKIEALPLTNNGTISDKMLYVYTSGTTGFPKAAVITNLRYMYMVYGIHCIFSLKVEDVFYDPLPLYHSGGGLAGAGQAILCGSTVVIRKKFSAGAFWKDCKKFQCTVAQYIGEICRYLLAVPKDKDIKHSVQKILGNGLRPQIWNQFVQRFNIPEVCEYYGSTEGNASLINLDNTVGAVGFVPRYARFLYPVVLVRCDLNTGEPLKDKKGNCTMCEIGEPGILLGKIDTMRILNKFSGYVDTKSTQKKILTNVFRKGDMYFNSGDILVQDEFGYFYFRDRTGDTFRWKGENVATSEVEAVISNLVSLNDAVVYGVEIPETEGKAGMAAIVDPENQLDLEALAQGLKATLPPYAIPVFIRIMKSVEITGTFKLKKVDLQNEGYNVDKINDDIYLYDSKSNNYIKLTKQLHNNILSGKIRL